MNYNVSQCIAFRLRRLSRIVDKRIRNMLDEVGVTENQMGILFALEMMGKVSQGDIGKNLVLERSTVSRGIQILVKKEYIIRSSDYQPDIELSLKGITLVKYLKPKWQVFMNEMYKEIGDEGFISIQYLENKLIS